MTEEPLWLNPLVVSIVAGVLFVAVIGLFGFFFVRFARSDDPLADIETAHTANGRGAATSAAARAIVGGGAAAESARRDLLRRMGFPGVAAIPEGDPAHLVAREIHAYRAEGPQADGRGARLVIFLGQEGVVTSAVVERVALLLGKREPGKPVPAGLPASALVVSAQAFTKEAWAAAGRAPVELVDGRQLEGLVGTEGGHGISSRP